MSWFRRKRRFVCGEVPFRADAVIAIVDKGEGVIAVMLDGGHVVRLTSGDFDPNSLAMFIEDAD